MQVMAVGEAAVAGTMRFRGGVRQGVRSAATSRLLQPPAQSSGASGVRSRSGPKRHHFTTCGQGARFSQARATSALRFVEGGGRSNTSQRPSFALQRFSEAARAFASTPSMVMG